MKNKMEQTRIQFDYEMVIQKAWTNFKSGKSMFSENVPNINQMNPRSYLKAFAKKIG